MIGDRPIDIEIDGGVTPETAPLVAAAGANVLVAGSAVFKGGTQTAYKSNIEAHSRGIRWRAALRLVTGTDRGDVQWLQFPPCVILDGNRATPD
jgi:hypothetical protein